MTLDGAAMIAEERLRQVEVERWTAEHDDEHDVAELTRAAMCYADKAAVQMVNNTRYSGDVRPAWPWDQASWKPSTDPVRNLVKAGALIAAEIDRIIRANQ